MIAANHQINNVFHCQQVMSVSCAPQYFTFCHHLYLFCPDLIFQHMARAVSGPVRMWSNKNVFDCRFWAGVSIIFYWSDTDQTTWAAVYEVYPENLYNYFLQPNFMIEGNQNWLLHLCCYLWSLFWYTASTLPSASRLLTDWYIQGVPNSHILDFLQHGQYLRESTD